MSEKKNAADRIIVASFQCQMQLTQNRTITFSGQFYDDDTLAERHARVDEYQDIIDRQFVRAELKNLEAQRTQRVAALEEHVRKLETLTKRQEALQRAAQNGGAKKGLALNSQERQMVERGQETTEQVGEQIKMLDSMIEACKKKLSLPEARA